MSIRSKLEDNIQALKIVLWNGSDGLTEQQVQQIKRYHGFGGIKAILYNPYEDTEWKSASKEDVNLRPLVQELYEVVGEAYPENWKKVINSLKNSTLSAFYTPKVVPDTLYDVIKDYHPVESVYDPCAGSGVFIESAMEILGDSIVHVRAYEKDMLTAEILKALYNVPIKVCSKPFEQSDSSEDRKYDLIASNVPFGAIPVYDPECNDKNISGKIHNYFVWKGLKKIKEQGILAYLITNAFLDSPSNSSVRKYLFTNSDLISLVVMPDNLYKETSNTEAPSHLLVVRKRSGKSADNMSDDEKKICESGMVSIHGVTVAVNKYIQRYSYCRIGKQKLGKNQYGKPSIETIWDKPIEDIKGPLEKILRRDMEKRYLIESKGIWKQLQENEPKFDVGNQLNQINILSSVFSKASEKAIEESGLSELFKTKEEWKEKLSEEREGTYQWDTEEIKETRKQIGINEEVEKKLIVKIEDDEEWSQNLESDEPVAGQSPEDKLLPEQKVIVRVEDCSVDPIPGTILEIVTGKIDMFRDRTELIQVTGVNGDDTINYIPAPVKPGKEGDIIRMYLKVRDSYLLLEKSQQEKTNR